MLAERQRADTVLVPAERGRIYSDDGSPLVINQKAYGVVLEPKKFTNKLLTAETVARDLTIPVATISALLSNENAVWVPIAHKVNEDKVTSLKSKKLPGIQYLDEQKRYYPEASMAAHLLGFVGKNSKGEDQGYFGLEGYYDQQLRGRDGYIHQEVDAQGNPIVSGDVERIDAEDGRDLILYLNKTMQFIAEMKLKEGIEKYEASGGTVTILDPRTGGVLAMAGFPSYGPGDYWEYPSEYYKNPVVAGSYEPGSTFKVLVMAMGINEKKVTPYTTFNEDGPVKIGGYSINTWNQQYHGQITMTQVLEYSSNVGMVFVSNKLDHDLLLRYIGKLGFGEPTNVDLEDETVPGLRLKTQWYPIDYATVSFGQGIAVTPLQMVRSVASIANGGKLMEPHVVQAIKLPDGNRIDIKPKVEQVIYNEETTKLLTEMMVQAVDNGETKRIKPSGYRIAGKTGTAQVAIAGHYDEAKTIASFVGFAPVEDPKFIMLVTVNEPKSSPWGSETAAPIFFSIAKDLFSLMGISPSY